MNSAAAKEENKADRRPASRYGCNNTNEMQRLLGAQDLSERSVKPEASPEPTSLQTFLLAQQGQMEMARSNELTARLQGSNGFSQVIARHLDPRTAGAQVSTASAASTSTTAIDWTLQTR